MTNTLYITEQGSTLRKVSRRLLVSKGGKTMAEIPIIKVHRVLIFGNVQVTSQAIAFLLDSGVDLCYLSTKGRFRGRLSPAESKNVLLRMAQYERYLDDGFQLEFSKTLVEAKIRNAKALVGRYSRNYPEMDFSEEMKTLDQGLIGLETRQQVSSVLGIEGHATAAYFHALGKMFRGDMAFSQRTKRPPKDPVNALLSFGYTLITNEMLSTLFATGFDPYIGYLHSMDYGRPSLALDMVEEFRHPVVDRFTLYLINNRVLSEEDFQDKGEEGFLLMPDALKRYFEHYERRMNETFQDRFGGERVCYRTLFRRQVQRLAKTIQTRVPYEPFKAE